MSVSKKTQIIIAAILTAALLIGLPVYAWFMNEKKVAELQKIREPDLLYLTAANAEDVRFFDLSSISVKDTEGDPVTEPQYYPFGVAGKYVSSFSLQLAHTTNNPFIYKIYYGSAYTTRAAAEAAAGANGVVVEYKLNGTWETLAENGVVLSGDPQPIPASSSQAVIYIVKGAELAGTYLNDTTDSGRVIADSTYHNLSYGSYSDLVKYAEPLFWQYSGIQSVTNPTYVGQPFMRTFLLEVSWTAADVTAGRIDNDKETDIVYVYAFRR